jgi:lactate permease
MWPALFLFHLADSVGGIQAVPFALKILIPDAKFLQLLLAWAFSGLLEGLAGFGLPVAVVSPMLVRLGCPPLQAVAAVAVGHAWAVTFGDMGVIFQTLLTIVNLPANTIILPASFMLGVACLACGFSAAWLLKLRGKVFQICLIGMVMGLVQWILARAGLAPLAAYWRPPS